MGGMPPTRRYHGPNGGDKIPGAMTFMATIMNNQVRHAEGANGIDKSSSRRFHLTFDIDWAPDESVDEIRRIINPKNIKATFFITHDSPILKDLVKDGHEIGIHPNFLERSSHGETPKEVVSHLLDIVPDARALRTHALVQSSPLLHDIFSSFPQLRYDLSVFMQDFPFVRPFKWAFEGAQFTRINYNWEDDAAFAQEGFSWRDAYFPGELSVYDFHPIHVHLNSCSSDSYRELKRSASAPLSELSSKTIAAHVNPSGGARTFLEALAGSGVEHIDFEKLVCV